MTPKIKIRPAYSEDCAQMMLLIKELAIYEKAPDAVTVSLEEFIDAGFGNQAIWKAFVAEQDDTIIGLSLFYPRYSTWKGKKLYLEDIVVKESFRGKKIGHQLFQATLDYAKENGYHSLFWQVLDWNETAINFYKKFGASFDKEWLNGTIDF
ncbi:MAG TPA: GNAT family N-acetyltransferase [Edaphocola sp.]|nr:GNAT family N-acetyltransferase [Edaphocola sp.]